MTTRTPKSKGARTITARLIRAVAADLRNNIDHLYSLADDYQNDKIEDLETVAAQVDFTLDHLAQDCKNPAWPRAWKYRTVIVRVCDRGPIQQTVPLGPAKCVVVVCANHAHAEEDIRRATWRNPRDRRIILVSGGDYLRRVQGLDRHTPWFCLSWPDRERDSREIAHFMNVRFERPVKSLVELISMIDWSVQMPRSSV